MLNVAKSERAAAAERAHRVCSCSLSKKEDRHSSTTSKAKFAIPAPGTVARGPACARERGDWCYCS
ncbi:unnamed protein product [Trichogramma brassicae]|uniref:Uncharacterized protein n=1 Tax=Trichogramma brassicae TaxID=86971 RepID=A0A6H5I9B6_9HYME|nr:unnamed protein product [Trichogramma brassicae]